MERGWRIEAWSREHGRGRVASEAGSLELDAAVALVDDFVVGELVDIVLEHGRVRQIQPRAARSSVGAVAEQLPRSWTQALAALRAQLGNGSALVVTAADEQRLTLEVRHAEQPQLRARCVATFDEVAYVQLAMRSTRFATVTARSWRDVYAARPRWLDTFSIELDDVEPDDVLVCFESDEFGTVPGFVIARSMTVR